MKEEKPDEIEYERQALGNADDAADAVVVHAMGEALPVLVLPDVESPLAETKEADAFDEIPLVLERKHPLAIRWMHWVNFPVLFTMVWSGLLIYWND